MLQWQAVFAILLVEIFICTIVILPLPLKIRKSVLEVIDKLTKHQTVSTILRVVFLLLVFLFIDAVRSGYNIEAKLEHHDDPHGHHVPIVNSCESHSRMFRAQRNS